MSRSLKRLRTLILRSATPLPPASCAASAFRSEGCFSLARPQKAYTACDVTENLLPCGGWPAGDASVTGTPRVVASKVKEQPASSAQSSNTDARLTIREPETRNAP